MDPSPKFSISRWLRSKTGLAFIAFLAIAAFFLITEHKAHLFGVLPYALLLLSLLLFLFMRRWQDGRNPHDSRQPEDGK
ncbi:MAG: DUF2933 domain-containing protein [Chloroflexi bacterium]|nr:DUF2933 domain-containing protein [Chloroflexota bacterium]